jgi:16S rRNA (uracil1498-N3)-methyltransferase
MSRFFFVEQLPALSDSPWTAPSELVRHIRALRLDVGSEIVLLPQSGDGVAAELLENSDLLLKSVIKRPFLDLPNISIASAWPKGSRGDELVRRATELGVKRLIPLSCERSVVGRKELSPSKVTRWHKITKEVCQQCRRTDLPLIEGELLTIKQLASTFSDHLRICLSPGATPLGQVVAQSDQPILLIVGPEGGFSPAEEQQLKEDGAQLAGIGQTILRIEAAGPTALAIASHSRQSK